MAPLGAADVQLKLANEPHVWDGADGEPEKRRPSAVTADYFFEPQSPVPVEPQCAWVGVGGRCSRSWGRERGLEEDFLHST